MPGSTISCGDRDSGDRDVPLFEVETAGMRLVFAPTIGGRLLGLGVDGVELLWQNPQLFDPSFRLVTPRSAWPSDMGGFSEWSNVGGSKSWPAPQGWNSRGEWPGPPDPVLDAGPYALNVEESAGTVTITLVSGDDPRTGLRIERQISLEAGSRDFVERVRLVNVSPAPVRWSPWEVAQVRAGLEHSPAAGSVTVGTVDDAEPLDLGRYHGEPVVTAGRPTVIEMQRVVAKWGWATAAGDIAYHRRDGRSIGLSTRPIDAAEYPDGGSRVALWMQTALPAPLAEPRGLWPTSDLVELELLGPLVELAPGHHTDLVVQWHAR